MTLGLMASLMLLPVSSFAQTTPQAPASWVEFQKQESAKRIVFFQQMKADRDAFLSSHPEAQTYLEEMHQAAIARMAAWKAAHQTKI